MEFLLVKALSAFLLPPGLNLSLAGIGALLMLRWRRIGAGVVALALVTLYLLSMSAVSGPMMASLETYPALTTGDGKQADVGAIVVLAGDRYANAPEYDGFDTVSRLTLERLRYAARLHRQTSLPVLLTGGAPLGQDFSLAFVMKQVLVDDFRVPVAWSEGNSRTTWENAEYTREILAEDGIARFYLVTHAWHMQRAMMAFRRMGLQPVAAPTRFTTRSSARDGKWLAWLPSAAALRQSSLAMHEYLGQVWYWLRY